MESLENAIRVVNRPRKYHGNPVLTYDRPWEDNRIEDASVLYDPEKGFEMWYENFKRNEKSGNVRDHMLCYATSTDGIHWEKPDLGLIEYQGSKRNNIVFMPKGEYEIEGVLRRGGVHNPTVIREEEGDPKRLYRLFYYSRFDRGIHVASSSDGLHWDPLEGIQVRAGDRNSAYYDQGLDRYRVITRIPGRGIRTCGMWESKDCEMWEFVEEALHPDEEDPPQTQLYGMVCFEYEGLRLGFLEIFHVPKRKLDTQLVYSLDGTQWHRACDRKTFLSWGPEGEWDSYWAFPINTPPIQAGDHLYIYYRGMKVPHRLSSDPPSYYMPYGPIHSIGLTVLRLDGFVSIDASCEEGVVTTAPLIFKGSQLHINAEAKPGYVVVELLDEEGRIIPDFAKRSCIPMDTEDNVDHIVRWKKKESLDELAGEPLKIRFYLRGAKLYSFEVA